LFPDHFVGFSSQVNIPIKFLKRIYKWVEERSGSIKDNKITANIELLRFLRLCNACGISNAPWTRFLSSEKRLKDLFEKSPWRDLMLQSIGEDISESSSIPSFSGEARGAFCCMTP
jgi:hypothetical protein